MPQYPNNNNTQSTSCDTSKCKMCRNKNGCAQYLAYLENIVQSPVASSVSSSIIPNNATIDLTQIIECNKEIKNSLTEAMVNEFLIIENQNKLILEKLEVISEKFTKLNKLIAMIDSYDVQNNPNSNGVAVYNNETDSGKILVPKTTKGLFGLGKEKTTWIEEDIDKNKEKDNQ